MKIITAFPIKKTWILISSQYLIRGILLKKIEYSKIKIINYKG
jgi:hypothetical protein